MLCPSSPSWVTACCVAMTATAYTSFNRQWTALCLSLYRYASSISPCSSITPSLSPHTLNQPSHPDSQPSHLTHQSSWLTSLHPHSTLSHPPSTLPPPSHPHCPHFHSHPHSHPPSTLTSHFHSHPHSTLPPSSLHTFTHTLTPSSPHPPSTLSLTPSLHPHSTPSLVTQTGRLLAPPKTHSQTPRKSKPAPSQRQTEGTVIELLNVFVDTLPHIPAHRRGLLFAHLLQCLGPTQHLHLMWALLARKYSSTPPQCSKEVGSCCE